MGLFSDCHQSYNSAEQLTADALGNNCIYMLQFDNYCLPDVGAAITKFQSAYCFSFPEATVLPKIRSCCNMGEDLEHWL